MARLTSNQATALDQVATKSTVATYLLDRTIPSLIARGFIPRETTKVEPQPLHYHTGFREGMVTGGYPGGGKVTYYLTETGRDEYIKMRTKWYESQREKLDKEYERDIAIAKRKTR